MKDMTMKRFALRTAVAGLFAAGTLALAGTATAASLGGTSADDAINQLTARGYNVQLNLNGARDEPLSVCIVNAVHGLPGGTVDQNAPAGQLSTVYVDVNCPPDN
jgi:hypothetical protein